LLYPTTLPRILANTCALHHISEKRDPVVIRTDETDMSETTIAVPPQPRPALFKDTELIRRPRPFVVGKLRHRLHKKAATFLAIAGIRPTLQKCLLEGSKQRLPRPALAQRQSSVSALRFGVNS
jgi:hypothetical protein